MVLRELFLVCVGETHMVKIDVDPFGQFYFVDVGSLVGITSMISSLSARLCVLSTGTGMVYIR